MPPAQLVPARKSHRSPPPVKVKPCIHCGRPAAKEVQFPQDGAIIIERYCEACLEPSYFGRLQEWYSKF